MAGKEEDLWLASPVANAERKIPYNAPEVPPIVVSIMVAMSSVACSKLEVQIPRERSACDPERSVIPQSPSPIRVS
jgi:hypothetical protein